MLHWARRIGTGVILWVIPYVSAIPMLDLARARPLQFKAFEVSIAAVTAAVLIAWYFRGISKNYRREAGLLAATWAVSNWLLDLVALLPFTKQSLPRYFLEIGIEYLAFAAIVVAVGALLGSKLEGPKVSEPPPR